MTTFDLKTRMQPMGTEVPAFFVVAIIATAAMIVFSIVAEMIRTSDCNEAKTAYQESLVALTNDPANPNLQKRTLELGRTYSNLTRNHKGIAMFDEAALTNDINIACRSTIVAAVPNSILLPALDLSLEDRLVRLAQLKEQGLVSEEEYDLKRQKLLDEI